MTEQMPKEQYEYIKRIQDDMLECTNMTENEAWDFAFRCWQCGYNKVNKELEQYRALGTVEELRVARDKQVVEEFCEWKTEKDLFIQNPHTKRKFSNEPSMKNTYCNTCGKKIKVVSR